MPWDMAVLLFLGVVTTLLTGDRLYQTLHRHHNNPGPWDMATLATRQDVERLESTLGRYQQETTMRLRSLEGMVKEHLGFHRGREGG